MVKLSDLPLVMTVDFVSTICGVNRKTVYEAVARGQIRSVRLGTAIRIPRAALAEFLGVTEEVTEDDVVPALRVVEAGP